MEEVLFFFKTLNSFIQKLVSSGQPYKTSLGPLDMNKLVF